MPAWGRLYIHLNVDPSVRLSNVVQVVGEYYFFWDDVKVYAHILIIWQGSAKVEVCQVNAKEDCSGHADRQVDEQFGGCEIGYWHFFVARVVNSIVTHCQKGTILLLLLRAKITYNLAVCGLFVGGDLRFVDEDTGFVPFSSRIPWKRHPILFAKLVSHTVFIVGFLTR
jgi:hypothetical protein